MGRLLISSMIACTSLYGSARYVTMPSRPRARDLRSEHGDPRLDARVGGLVGRDARHEETRAPLDLGVWVAAHSDNAVGLPLAEPGTVGRPTRPLADGRPAPVCGCGPRPRPSPCADGDGPAAGSGPTTPVPPCRHRFIGTGSPDGSASTRLWDAPNADTCGSATATIRAAAVRTSRPIGVPRPDGAACAPWRAAGGHSLGLTGDMAPAGPRSRLEPVRSVGPVLVGRVYSVKSRWTLRGGDVFLDSLSQGGRCHDV